MRDKKKTQWTLKVALLGDPAVGKTSLIENYITHSFKENYHPTLGVNIVTKDIRLEESNMEIRLILWDIAGQDKYDLTRKMFFQGCTGAFLVYDKTRYSTFNQITTKWLEDFNKFARHDGTYVLIGNKIDLKDSIKVTTAEGEALAQKIKAEEFLETSAKYGENVEKAFTKLVMHILSKNGVNMK
ncbi:MAG: Rab family GTPase [Promethearchaeota archaeon]